MLWLDGCARNTTRSQLRHNEKLISRDATFSDRFSDFFLNLTTAITVSCVDVAVTDFQGFQTAVLPELLEASLLLQHRGQDACGIATHDRNGNPAVHKNYGLVTEVFGEAETGLQNLSGSMGIAHGKPVFCPIWCRSRMLIFSIAVRYRTSGRSTLAEVQPLQNPARPDVTLCHVSTNGRMQYGNSR